MYHTRYIFSLKEVALVGTAKKVSAVFYQTASGNEPVRDRLKQDIGYDERRVIGSDIATVEFGWPIGMPVSRSLGGGLHEVRSNLPGNRIARVIFCVHAEQMILLHGFIKKTRATPKTDLNLARERKREIGL